jgi:hypothetical protein
LWLLVIDGQHGTHVFQWGVTVTRMLGLLTQRISIVTMSFDDGHPENFVRDRVGICPEPPLPEIAFL